MAQKLNMKKKCLISELDVELIYKINESKKVFIIIGKNKEGKRCVYLSISCSIEAYEIFEIAAENVNVNGELHDLGYNYFKLKMDNPLLFINDKINKFGEMIINILDEKKEEFINETK